MTQQFKFMISFIIIMIAFWRSVGIVGPLVDLSLDNPSDVVTQNIPIKTYSSPTKPRIAPVRRQFWVVQLSCRKSIIIYSPYLREEFTRGVMVKVLDCNPEVSEFELQSFYYVNFRIYAVEKGKNSPYPISYCCIVNTIMTSDTVL